VIRVVLADDEELIRGALVALLNLEHDITVVGEAGDGAEAVELAARLRPDVAVLDLEMPVMDGIEAATRIVRRPPTKAVLVTRHARPGVLRRALSGGVAGFVPKSTPAAKLAHVIRDVHAGRRYVDSDIAASALAGQTCPLTARELDVLRLTRQGLSINQIAGELFLASGTVRNYLSAAMTKLGSTSRSAAATVAWEQGWI
jgi:two-component system, NarL family, response regulator DesR